MKTLRSRIKRFSGLKRAGLGIFVGLGVITVLTLALPKGAFSRPAELADPAKGTITASSGEVSIRGSLSQTKIVQGSDGPVYLEVEIGTGKTKDSKEERKATDMVVVLDRSGSMSEDNKLPYAKAAIRELLSQMNSDDRFALVAFDSYAIVYAALTPVTDSQREKLNLTVSSLTPGNATNISDGLARARHILSSSSSGRVKRLLLLSDGQANQGTTNPHELAKMASGLSEEQVVLSTIGMGLGFNETLMSSLADHGMGNYSYLENLENLPIVLAKDLKDARALFAAKSEIEISLPSGVRIEDAAGYPITRSNSVKISTGQLLKGAKKSFIITLRVSSDRIREAVIEKLSLHYAKSDEISGTVSSDEQLVVAVVENSREKEAVASIVERVFRRS